MTNIDEPPGRTRYVGLANAVFKAGWGSGAVRKPALDPASLLQRVSDKAGMDDYGDPWFREPFDVLIEAILAEAQLNPLGRFVAVKQFEKVLRDRLLAQYWFNRHPEILARPVHRPVIIAGPMRSGTTRLHRLLASDRRFAYLRFFETLSPVPEPGFDNGARDRRPALAATALRLIRSANPRTAVIHPTGPMDPEEELGLLVNSMWGMKHEAQWHIPSYARWSESVDAQPAYEQLARLLRLVGWSQQESSLKPWLLKTPQHMLDLSAMMKVFPDARVIFIHRDPASVVGSACSLVWNQMILHSDHVDPIRLGEEWLAKTRLQIERACRARKSLPEAQVMDVHYDAMDCDWRAEMERVYRFLGLDMEPATQSMADYMERARKDHPERHRYSLAAYGLTEDRVLGDLSEYLREFDVTVRVPGKSLTASRIH